MTKAWLVACKSETLFIYSAIQCTPELWNWGTLFSNVIQKGRKPSSRTELSNFRFNCAVARVSLVPCWDKEVPPYKTEQITRTLSLSYDEQCKILYFSTLPQNPSQQNGASFSKSHKVTLSMELWRKNDVSFIILSLACKVRTYKTKLACWIDYTNTKTRSSINNGTLLELI